MISISGIKILKDDKNLYYGVIDDEEITSKYKTIDEVYNTIDYYYYRMYDNSGCTTNARLNIKKKQPKGKGVVATMSIKVIELY